MKKAVFLDRDGVITIPNFKEGRSFAPTTLEEFRMYPRSVEALSLLKKLGYLLIIVTNQPDIGRGIISSDIMRKMNDCLLQALPIDVIKVCPHMSQDLCGCRKPLPGLLREASADLGEIEYSQSYMIGDRESDIRAGQAMGCINIFIDLGYERETRPLDAHFNCKNLWEASCWIMRQEQKLSHLM